MKTKKVMLMITSVLMVVMLTMLQPVLAWFYYYRTNFLVLTGDIELSVDGYYQVATDASVLEYTTSLEYEKVFNFKDVSMDNFIAFKFEVKNIHKRDAMLSMRLSDFTDCMFDHFDEYYEDKKDDGNIGSELAEKIYKTAESNTAKIATVISDMYYKDIDGSEKEINVVNPYTWKYGYGEKIFDGIYLPGVTIDDEGDEIVSKVELYFSIRADQRTGSMDDYRRWLYGYTDVDDQKIPGYGHERLANKLGWASWGDIPAGYENDKVIADTYLKDFISSELTSISTIDPSEGLAIIRLDIRYFEFIGENIRPD